jgi:hypothetical protein
MRIKSREVVATGAVAYALPPQSDCAVDPNQCATAHRPALSYGRRNKDARDDTLQMLVFITKLPQPSFKVLHAETDAEARRMVSLILRNVPQIERVEAWRDGDFAFRVNQHQVHLEMCYAGNA